MTGPRVVFNKKTNRYEAIGKDQSRGSETPYQSEPIDFYEDYTEPEEHGFEYPSFVMERPDESLEEVRKPRAVTKSKNPAGRAPVKHRDKDDNTDIYKQRRQKLVNAFKPKKRK